MSYFVTVELIKGFHKGSLASCPSFLSFTASCPTLYLLYRRFLPTGTPYAYDRTKTLRILYRSTPFLPNA